jgi:uncharacterized protein
MPPRIALAALKLLLDYSQGAPTVTVTLFGGEPTLNFRLIQLLSAHGKAAAEERGKRIEFTMTSNGLHVTPKMADYFRDNGIRVLLSIGEFRLCSGQLSPGGAT